MDTSSDNFAYFSQLIDSGRVRDAFVFFLQQVQGKSWTDLRPVEMAMLDRTCQRLLPELLEDHTLWMVHHPDRLRLILDLLTEALRARYRPAATVDQIAWLRCLLAISEAMAGRPERVHEELCIRNPHGQAQGHVELNGTFHQQVQSLQLRERSVVSFLQGFFAAYLAFLRRAGKHELANHLESRIGRLLGLIARDEKRPGVVQALLHSNGRGYSRFVHVRLEHQPQIEPGIVYAAGPRESIDAVMQDAAVCARLAADAYLQRAGYPDGLAERLVRWELTTLQGDTTSALQRYTGGSVALPLAVAVISEYLARPVPNDVALTGAFSEVSSGAGWILPVDGICEKIEHAVTSGSRLVYVPAGNAEQIDQRPSLRKLVAEHNARVEQVGRLDQVCQQLFHPEGSGRLSDLLRDTLGNLRDMLGGLRAARQTAETPADRPVHVRHRMYVLICALLTGVIVFMEGWMVYKAFAANYSPVLAWARITAAGLLASAAMLGAFALPAACLRHRKDWSWFAGIAILAVALTAGLMLIGPVLPNSTWISFVYNAPPAAGLMKDLFVIWFFAWAVAANVFNVVAALEHLVRNRQFVTARNCLGWNSPLEGRMPIRCVGFPWTAGAVAIAAVVMFLMVLELNYYASLRWGTTAAYWQTFLGLGRDCLIIAGISIAMLFYKDALTNIRTALA